MRKHNIRVRRLTKRMRRKMIGCFVLVLYRLVKRFPCNVLRFGVCIGSLIVYMVSVHSRKRVHAHLARAFPEHGREYRKGLAFSVYSRFGRIGVDVLEFQRAHCDRRMPQVAVDVDWQALGDELLRRGALVVTGHLGAWEILGGAFSQCFPGRLAVIAKRIYVPCLNNLVTGFREAFGTKVIFQDEPLQTSIRFLQKRNVLGVLPDQDLRRLAGAFYPFFGRTAWTPTGPAALSIIARVPVFCLFLVYDNGVYRLVKEGPFFPESIAGSREEKIAVLTKQWTEALEKTIRRYPDQWVWFHDRWRTQPGYIRKRGRRMTFIR